MGFSFKSASFQPDAEVEFILDSISEDQVNPITFRVKHAGHGNAAFRNAHTKSMADLQNRYSSAVSTPAYDNAVRAADVELLADHVIVGWKNVLEDGAPATFSNAKLKEFLYELIKEPPVGRPDVFDRLRGWVRNAENFRIAKTLSAEQVGKG